MAKTKQPQTTTKPKPTAAKKKTSATKSPAAAKPTRGATRNKLSVEQKAIIRAMPDDAFDIPVIIEPRCHVCRIGMTDRDLARWVNKSLLDGTPYEEIIARAGVAGHDLSVQKLSRHRNNHVLIFVMNALTTHAELSAIAQKVGDVQDGNVGVIVARFVCLQCLLAIKALSPAKLQSLGPEKLSKLALQAASITGQVQSADATTRLRAAELQRKMLQLTDDERAIIRRAVEQIRVENRDKPEILAKFEAVVNELLAPAEPEGGEAT